jgi:hypothetical protein
VSIRREWPGGKPPLWPDGELPPWSKEERPSLLEFTLAYPGKAISSLFGMALVGLILGSIILRAASRIFPALWGPSGVALVVIVVAALWWYVMDGVVCGSRLLGSIDDDFSAGD